MSTDTDLIKLYSTQILGLAADIPNLERLTAPDASTKKRSPLCGSTVTVDVNSKDGHVSQFGLDVKACALGQASASVLSASIIGCSLADLERAQEQLKGMLKNNGPVPDAPFEGFKVLTPAREFKNRHASIMLALDASVEALRDANQKACA
ncbi:MAG: iron-sulfur cluster assembly scaffold protein [Litoreibacter sp.]